MAVSIKRKQDRAGLGVVLNCTKVADVDKSRPPHTALSSLRVENGQEQFQTLKANYTTHHNTTTRPLVWQAANKLAGSVKTRCFEAGSVEKALAKGLPIGENCPKRN